MEQLLYSAQSVKELSENPAFRAFMQDIKERIAIVQSELESAPKDSVYSLTPSGDLKVVRGAEYHQGELASLRFFENAETILKDDLEGGVHNA